MYRRAAVWTPIVLIISFTTLFIISNFSISEMRMQPQDEKYNITLLVSNQSIDINPVDIEIRIDNRLAVHANFDSSGVQPSQHNWESFHFQLENGDHTIVISSEKGEARLEKTFEVNSVHTVTIAYWYDASDHRTKSAKFFTFNIVEGSVGLM